MLAHCGILISDSEQRLWRSSLCARALWPLRARRQARAEPFAPCACATLQGAPTPLGRAPGEEDLGLGQPELDPNAVLGQVGWGVGS